MQREICPICHNPDIKTCLIGRNYQQEINCQDCGCYVIPRCKRSLITSITAENKILGCKCAAVMLERNLKGLNDNVKLDYEGNKSLFFVDTGECLEAYYPTTFYEKLERGFFNLVRSLKHSPLVKFSIKELKRKERSLLFIADPLENYKIVLDYICAEGWLQQFDGKEGEDTRYRVTTKGMQLFDVVAVNKSPNAFLAMWFGADKDEKYRDAVRRAVTDAGYHLHVVDDEHYNGFIMDKVINLINDSAFVIADITAEPEQIKDNSVFQGVRGGVYWEAGYAAGQKKQVILTCRDDSETTKRIHFDLQQYNQIRWHNEDGRVTTSNGQDFTDVLTQRILASVGRGPHRIVSEINE